MLNYAQELRIALIFLPRYSPNLNLIERLWKFVKKKAVYSRCFADFDLFKKVIHQVLDNLEQYKKELNSLLSPNFQSYENVHIIRV